MYTPEIDSLWIDNDPRNSRGVRYALVTGERFGGKVPCVTWYDVAGGATTPRVTHNNIQRFRQLSGGGWSRTGFRPAEHPPVLGYPHGYGPDAEPYVGSDS